MKAAWDKVNKSEFWIAIAALIATLIAPQLGMSEDTIQAALLNILGITGVYVGGRSYSKPREAAAANPTKVGPVS